MSPLGSYPTALIMLESTCSRRIRAVIVIRPDLHRYREWRLRGSGAHPLSPLGREQRHAVGAQPPISAEEVVSMVAFNAIACPHIGGRRARVVVEHEQL